MEKEKNIDNLELENNEAQNEVNTEEDSSSEETAISNEEYILSEEEKIELELHKLEVEMEKIENFVNQINVEVSDDLRAEYENLKSQHKELRLELRAMKKVEKTIFDKIPIWMYFYGIAVLVLFFPLFSLPIWLKFFDFVAKLFVNSLNQVFINAPTAFINFLTILLIYSLPLFCFLISWIVHSFVLRKKEIKKYFSYIWIGQTILTIITCVWLYFDSIRGFLR